VKGWERITWDDVLDLAAEKLSYNRDKFGPLSILVVNYSGIRGSVAKILGCVFWSHFGVATFTRPLVTMIGLGPSYWRTGGSFYPSLAPIFPGR
jgi:anaerobic selenocysteine-containing dehydrogenase